jgi:hypothetical protein
MGVVKFAEEVYSTGNEKSFITSVVTYLTNLDSRITCISDIDAEFDETDLSHIPIIKFYIDDKIYLTLTRVNALSNQTYQYYVDCKGVRATVSWGTSYQRWVATRRHYAISSIINDNFILLSINGYYSNGYPSNDNFNIVYTKQSSGSYYSTATNITFGLTNIFDISSRTFYLNVFGGGAYGTFTSRFPYKANAGYIDYTNGGIYVSNTQKQFTLNCIRDCTEVTVGTSVALRDGTYYAIGPHQLVKVLDIEET